MIRSCSRRWGFRDSRAMLSRDSRRMPLSPGLGTSGQRNWGRRKRCAGSRCWENGIIAPYPDEQSQFWTAFELHEVVYRRDEIEGSSFKTRTEDATMGMRIRRLVALAAFGFATAAWAAGPEVDPASV